MSINEKMLTIMHSNNNFEKNLSKYIIGEFQRYSTNINKTVDDDIAIKILKKLKKDYKENKKYYDHEEINNTLNFIDVFLPKEVDKKEIIDFLETIDFNNLKNKMQAIGIVQKHFKGNVDNKLVKDIIQNEY